MTSPEIERRNQVVIITGTGDRWMGGIEPASFAEPPSTWPSDLITDQLNDGMNDLRAAYTAQLLSIR